MRNLKTIFVLSAILIANSAFSQTKAETIEWLKTNGKDFLTAFYCGNSEKYYIEITDDVLTIIVYDKTVGTPTHYYSNLKWNNILYQDVSSVSKSQSNDCPQIKLFVIKAQEYNEYSMEKGGKKSDVKVEKGNIYLRYDAEKEEDVKRTLKAIMHLAKLSGAKENKQTF